MRSNPRKRPTMKKAIQDAYEKELAELAKETTETEDTSPDLDDELDFDSEHYNRIETTYDD